jgi:hypothetical protein
MSQENVEIVKRAVASVNQRDIDGYLACCTEDVQLITPIADVAGAYDGREGIRRFFADIADTVPDFKITIERLEAVGANPGLGPHASDRNRASEWHSDRGGHRERLRPCGRQDQGHPNLRRPQSGPRSRRAVGVGDVAGERRTG